MFCFRERFIQEIIIIADHGADRVPVAISVAYCGAMTVSPADGIAIPGARAKRISVAGPVAPGGAVAFTGYVDVSGRLADQTVDIVLESRGTLTTKLV